MSDQFDPFADFQKALTALTKGHIQSFLRERYGSHALRIYNMLEERGCLSQKQVRTMLGKSRSSLHLDRRHGHDQCQRSSTVRLLHVHRRHAIARSTTVLLQRVLYVTLFVR